MSRSLIGWDGAGGGYFERPERPELDDGPLGQGPPMTYLEVEVWCDRCGRPRRESVMCVACGEMDDAPMAPREDAG